LATPSKVRQLKRLLKRAGVLKLEPGESLGDMYVGQVCEVCGGTGDGIGIEHTDDCLVPLAQAAEDAGG